MSRARRSTAVLLLLVGLVAAWLVWAPVGEAQPSAGSSGSPKQVGFDSMPPLALVLSPPVAPTSALHFAQGPSPSKPAGEIGPARGEVHHLGSGSVRATLLKSTSTVLVTAPIARRTDPSFDGGLFLLQPGTAARLLADRVVHASSPWVTRSGRVLVSRGVAGPVGDPASMRVDELSVDAVDPGSGAAQTLLHHDGYLAFIAGAFDDEALVYRVGPSGADLVSVALDTGATSILLPSLLPFARDFSVDEPRRRVLWRNRHETDTRQWVVEQLDVASGSVQRLLEDPSFALCPHVWPDGGFAASPGGGGLALVGSQDRLRAPLGPGVDSVRALSRDGRYVAMLHTVAGALPVAFVVDREAQTVWRVPTNGRVDIAIAGFVENAGGAP